MPGPAGLFLRFKYSLLIAVVMLALVMFYSLAATWDDERKDVSYSAAGNALAGAIDAEEPEDFLLAKGEISLAASDLGDDGGNGGDRLAVDATFEINGNVYQLWVRQAIVSEPLGRHQTWGGVGRDKRMDQAGEGLPPQALGEKAELIAFGYANIMCHDDVVGFAVPVRIVKTDAGLPAGARLALDIGDGRDSLVRNLPGGMKQMRVLWRDVQQGAEAPPATTPATAPGGMDM